MPPTSTTVDGTRIDIVSGIHSVNALLSPVDLSQTSVHLNPLARARLLAFVDLICVVDAPDVAVTRGRHVLQSSRNVLPSTTTVHWALKDLATRVHSPHLVIVYVQLFQSSINLLPIAVARTRADEDLTRFVNSPYVVDVSRYLGQSSRNLRPLSSSSSSC